MDLLYWVVGQGRDAWGDHRRGDEEMIWDGMDEVYSVHVAHNAVTTKVTRQRK